MVSNRILIQSVRQTVVSTVFFFAFVLAASTVGLYARHPFFLDRIPFFLLAAVGGFSLIAGVVFTAVIRPLRWIPSCRSRMDALERPVGISLAGLSIFLLMLSIGVGWMGSRSEILIPQPPRLLVIGLDGATWDLLTPWMEAGKLPHLQSIRKQGVSSTLMSMEPIRSPSLWTTICTGVSPEVHGISGFFSTRADLKTARVWDVFAANGLNVGLFGWLLTSPPERHLTFCVPAWLARTSETHPFEYRFVQELNLGQSVAGGSVDVMGALLQALRYGARIGGVEAFARFAFCDAWGLDDEQRLSRKMLAEAPLQTDVFLHLLREYQPDIATFTFYGSDKLAHRFWHYMAPDQFPNHAIQPRDDFHTVIERYYQKVDHAIGRMLRSIDENTTVVVLSDHGMKADPALPRQFFLDVAALLRTLGIEALFRHHTIMRQTFLEPVIEDPLLLEETRAILQAFQFDDGEPVFRAMVDHGKIVLRTDFSLTWNEESPLLTQDHIRYARQTIPIGDLFFLRTFSGAHDRGGVLMMKGPHIQPGKTIGDSQLTDIAPTLLFLMHQPVSREIEGRILEEAFHPDWFHHQPVEYVDSYNFIRPPSASPSTENALLERLRGMGYVE